MIGTAKVRSPTSRIGADSSRISRRCCSTRARVVFSSSIVCPRAAASRSASTRAVSSLCSMRGPLLARHGIAQPLGANPMPVGSARGVDLEQLFDGLARERGAKHLLGPSGVAHPGDPRRRRAECNDRGGILFDDAAVGLHEHAHDRGVPRHRDDPLHRGRVGVGDVQRLVEDAEAPVGQDHAAQIQHQHGWNAAGIERPLFTQDGAGSHALDEVTRAGNHLLGDAGDDVVLLELVDVAGLPEREPERVGPDELDGLRLEDPRWHGCLFEAGAAVFEAKVLRHESCRLSGGGAPVGSLGSLASAEESMRRRNRIDEMRKPVQASTVA